MMGNRLIAQTSSRTLSVMFESQILLSIKTYCPAGVNLIKHLQVKFTGIAIVLKAVNNSYTCKCFIKLTPVRQRDKVVTVLV